MGKRLGGKGRKHLKKVEKTKEEKRTHKPACVRLRSLALIKARDVWSAPPPQGDWMPAGLGRGGLTLVTREYDGTLNRFGIRRVIPVRTQYKCEWALERPCIRASTSKVLLHGTEIRNAASIVGRGFRLPRLSGMFGQGVYFTDAYEKCIKHTYSDGIIIHALVDLGKTYTAIEADNTFYRSKIEALGFDSVQGKKHFTKAWGGTLINNEWCVYDPQRVFIFRIEKWSLQA